MNEHGTVAVVVVTWNSAAILAPLIESLPDAFGDLTWELIVADNDSTDDTVATVRRLAPRARVVELGANLGYAAGVNAGVAAASDATAVLLLNPDIRLEPGSVPPLVRAASEPGAGIAVPLLVDEHDRLLHSLRRDPSVTRALGEAVLGGERAGRYPRLGEVVSDAACYTAPHAVDWATGAAMVMTTDCLAKVGPWDESFFLYSEETDFALRARDRGYRVCFVPDAHAVHLGGEVHTSGHLWTLLTVNRTRLFARRHGRLRARAFVAAVALNEALRALAGRPHHREALLALSSPTRWPSEIRPR